MKKYLLIAGILLIIAMAGASTNDTKLPLDAWSTSFSIWLTNDSIWWDAPTQIFYGTGVDYDGGVGTLNPTDSTTYGWYVKVWARKMNDITNEPESCAVNPTTSYSYVYHAGHEIQTMLHGTPFQMFGSTDLGGFEHIMNIQFSFTNIKEIDGTSSFDFNTNDSLFVYIEDRYGFFSCYSHAPDMGSQNMFLAFAWASSPGATYPLTEGDPLSFSNPSPLDSVHRDFSDWAEVTEGDECMAGVNEKPVIPMVPTLGQNSPNPFNASTDIEFMIPEAAHVRLEITDVLGKHVALLKDSEMAQGNYNLRWEGTDDERNEMPSGVYFYKLTVGDSFIDKKKMTLVK